jgi:hypothetical protein
VKDHNIWKEDYIVPIKPSGTPLTTTEIQTEFGDPSPISFSEYYGLASGIPSSGAIPMSTFYGKTFLIIDRITSSGTWSPRPNLARFIHIFVVGAGGSGGMAWPARNVGFFGNTDGVAGGSGGGAGGVAYSRITGTTTGSATVTVGTGGTGVGVTGERSAVNGNAGTTSSFIGLGLNMSAGGGGGGLGGQNTDGGNTSLTRVGGTGGSASGGNQSNLTGGSGGGFSVSGSNPRTSAAGGGAPRFLTANNGTATNSTTDATTPGISVSSYGAYPAVAAYAAGRSQPFLGSSITDFNASAGVRGAGSAAVTYGAGSGGVAAEAAVRSGRGGNGVIIIVYEV